MIRRIGITVVFFLIPHAVFADTRELERELYETLRDVHDRGAALYDAGERQAVYRMFEACLLTTRAALVHRPDLRKMISQGLSAAERQPTIGHQAFFLHEQIEKVRAELKKSLSTKSGEFLTIQPREIVPPKPVVGEATEGILGKLKVKGIAIPGARIRLVTLDRWLPRTFRAQTDSTGSYVMPAVSPGRYAVLVIPPEKPDPRLPEIAVRYGKQETTPLIMELMGRGEKVDLLLGD